MLERFSQTLNSSEEFNRREFFRRAKKGVVTVGKVALVVKLGWLLAACKDGSFDQQTVLPQSKEQEDVPRMGDVVMVDGRPLLLRNNKMYPIPDLETYKHVTKFEQYGRKVSNLPVGNLQNYPLGEATYGEMVYDKTTRTEKVKRPFGQEILVFFPGFITDGGMPYEIIKPVKDTFISMLVGFKPKHWGLEDSFFFTYGKGRLVEYEAKDTSRPLEENEKNAVEFLAALKEEFPLAQFNLFGHSLGAVFALAAAKAHVDAVNAVTIVSGPIRGIEGTFWRRRFVEWGRPLIKPYIGDEKVTAELFRRWEDKTYQRELEAFVSHFTSVGRKLVLVINKDDPIVPSEAVAVKGAKEIPIAKTPNAVSRLPSPGWLVEHGRPLRDEGVIQQVAEETGENLAKAA